MDEGLDLVKGVGNSAIRLIDAGGDIRKAGKHRIDFVQEGLSTTKSVVENGVDKINPLKHKVFGQSLEFNLQFFGKHGDDTVSLYRAVSPEEFYDIMETKSFRTVMQSYEGKQFGLNLEEVIDLANKSIMQDTSAIVKVNIPKSLFERLNHTKVDSHILKSGSTTVDRDMLEEFNKIIKNQIEHVF